MPDSVVVVGGGLAGLQSVAALRGQGYDGALTLVGAEERPPYDRPPLSKELLARTEPLDLAQDLGLDLPALAEVHLAESAETLALADDGVVVTTRTPDGRTLERRADAVVAATGSRAVAPAAWQEAGALVLHTAADAAALRGRLGPGVRLVVVGAGWVGAEVAGVAAAAGVEVTVVEAAEVPLAGALGEVGSLTLPWYAAAGVRLLTGQPVAAVRPGEVELAGGEVLSADVVLAATGARPASEWLAQALPRTADGSVPVDEWSAPLDPATGERVAHAERVRVVGDLALRRSPRHGWVPGGHWDAALRGPATAVTGLLADLAGGRSLGPGHGTLPPAADPAPYVFSTQLGHELGLHGQPGPGDEVVLRGEPHAPPVGVLWFAPGTDVLTAALAIDRPRDVAGARRLFAGPALPRVDRERAADPGNRLDQCAK